MAFESGWVRNQAEQ